MYKNKLEAISKDLAEARWVFAKTMPEHPHHYTLKKDWKGAVPFDEVVAFMRENSYEEKFFKKTMQRFKANGMKYWTMGYPIDRTILINRAELEA